MNDNEIMCNMKVAEGNKLCDPETDLWANAKQKITPTFMQGYRRQLSFL